MSIAAFERGGDGSLPLLNALPITGLAAQGREVRNISSLKNYMLIMLAE